VNSNDHVLSQRHWEGRALDSRLWGAQQLLCVPRWEPRLAEPARLSREQLGQDQHSVPKAVSFPTAGLSGTRPRADKAHRKGEGQGDLIVHLSIYLSSCLDIIRQQTDFSLSLIRPDPKFFKFDQSGNTRPLSEKSKSSNSYQHHRFFFP